MKSNKFFTLNVDLAPMLDIGMGPNGYRRVIPITGGRFEGRISGDILPGGADWNLVRPDGTVHLWARYTLRTDEGALIMITNEGFQPGDPEMMDLILSGKPFDTSKWYARTRPVFETSDPKIAWINSRVFIGDLLAPTGPGAVVIDIHEVL